MLLSFDRLNDEKVEEAFRILRRVATWLESQNIQQRIAKLTLETYRQWQSEQENWIVSSNDQILGVVTLRKERLEEWPAFSQLKPVWMMRGLATHPEFFGQGIGSFAISSAITRLANSDLYLDCVSDTLPQYYSKHGFNTIAQQHRSYPDAPDCFDITLMKYSSQLPNWQNLDTRKPSS